MRMSKETNNKLVVIAETILQNRTRPTSLLRSDFLRIMDPSYNGKIAGFPVSVAIIGLLPTLAIYYSDRDNRAVNQRCILDVLARMLMDYRYPGITDARGLLGYAIEHPDDSCFKNDLLCCSIALKQVIRTYM